MVRLELGPAARVTAMMGVLMIMLIILAVLALIAASVLDPGVYCSMNSPPSVIGTTVERPVLVNTRAPGA